MATLVSVNDGEQLNPTKYDLPQLLQNICKIKDLSPTSTSINIYVKVLNVLVVAQRKYEDGTIIDWSIDS